MADAKNNIVLAATDFHDVAQYAIEHAIEIAKVFGYKLVVAHVYKKKKAKLTSEEAIERLQKITDKIKAEHNIPAEYMFSEGDPMYTINEIASDIGANYLSIGTRGKTGVEYVFGNYTAKIVQNSPIPVLVAKNRHENINYKKIVLPLDYTLESRQKAKWAILFAKKWDSTLCIYAENPDSSGHKQKLFSNMKLFTKIFDENHVKFEKSFCEKPRSDVGKEAINYAVSIKADLIIASSKLGILTPSKISLGLFSGGSDEEFIQKSAQIPYLCVNPQNLNVIIGGL